MELELKQLFHYARRWWWLLLLLPLITGLTSYTVASRQQPLYSATATLLINPASNTGANELTAINAGQQLALTYQQLVVTEPVLQPVIDRLGLPYGVDKLKTKVSATASRDTQLLRVSVSDPNPRAAATIANTISTQFAAFITQQTAASNTPSRTALQNLINDTQSRLDAARARTAELEAKPRLTTAEQSELDTLRTQSPQLQKSLGDLLLQAQQMDVTAASAQSRIVPSVPATPPAEPYAPRTLFYTLLAAFLGLLVAIGTVALVEYLDNTVKASLDFPATFGVPLLATVGRIRKLHPGRDQLFVPKAPRSNQAEAVRLLRTNLEFAAAAGEIKTLAVTSTAAGEGKSTIAANLAVAMAQSGLRTVLIDADLRKPTQQKIWGVAPERGLSTLLTHNEQAWQRTAVLDIMPNLALITSGPLPPSPGDLVSLDRFGRLLREMAKTVDLVILDTPPLLVASDALAMATNVHGVVVVAHAGKTRIETIRHTLGMLRDGSVRVVGLVLNRATHRDMDGYYYYSGYYGTDEAPPAQAASNGHAPPAEGRRLGRRPASVPPMES